MYIEKNDTIKLLDQTAVRISDSGYAIVDCEWIMDQLPSNFSRLYFICSGEGEISYAGQTVIPRPCHMYLIPPGLQFEYGCENSMEKIFFHISVILQNNFDLFDNLSKCYELPLEPGDRGIPHKGHFPCSSGNSHCTCPLFRIHRPLSAAASNIFSVDS